MFAVRIFGDRKKLIAAQSRCKRKSGYNKNSQLIELLPAHEFTNQFTTDKKNTKAFTSVSPGLLTELKSQLR